MCSQVPGLVWVKLVVRTQHVKLNAGNVLSQIRNTCFCLACNSPLVETCTTEDECCWANWSAKRGLVRDAPAGGMAF